MRKVFLCHKRKIFQISSNSFCSLYFYCKVLTRKGQLEELYVDNQELEGKRREVEAWLARMEAWQDRMQPVTPDLLESQVRENKVNLTINSSTRLWVCKFCPESFFSKCPKSLLMDFFSSVNVKIIWIRKSLLWP